MLHIYKSTKRIAKYSNAEIIYKVIDPYGLVFSIKAYNGQVAFGYDCLPKLKKHKNFLNKVCITQAKPA